MKTRIKNLLVIAICFFGLTTVLDAQNTPSYVPTNGLIGWFPFSGNANDLSGNNNNGKVTGANLTTDRFNHSDSAYDFPNSNDNITINSITQANVLKYSIFGWFKKTSNSKNVEGNIFCGSYPCNAPGGLRLTIGGNNQACFGVEYDSCSSLWLFTKMQNYADDKWHSFGVIFDAKTGLIDTTMLKIYIDTVVVDQHKFTQGNLKKVIAPINNSLPTIIGNATGGNNNFKGKLDDIGIWNRVLTYSEIVALHNGDICSPKPKAAFIAYDVCEIDSSSFINQSQGAKTYIWKFGDGQNSTLHSPKHLYNIGGISKSFNVSLVALVSNGCSDTITKAVTVNANPISDFTYNITKQGVEFNSTQLGNTSYKWSFGNGDSSTNKDVVYKYPQLGQYNACLKVTNAANCFSKTCKSILITIGVGIKPFNKQLNFKISPNPNSGNFNVEKIETKEILIIEIINQIGQIILKLELNENLNFINLNLDNGIYLCRISNGENKLYQRMIVTK